VQVAQGSALAKKGLAHCARPSLEGSSIPEEKLALLSLLLTCPLEPWRRRKTQTLAEKGLARGLSRFAHP